MTGLLIALAALGTLFVLSSKDAQAKDMAARPHTTTMPEDLLEKYQFALYGTYDTDHLRAVEAELRQAGYTFEANELKKLSTHLDSASPEEFEAYKQWILSMTGGPVYDVPDNVPPAPEEEGLV